MKKYELTNEIIKVDGKILYRIKSLKDFADVKSGETGGFIESEENLSHIGDAWVYDNAGVCENARIYGNAKICGDSWISGNARIYDNSEVSDNACVSDNARVYNDAWVYDNARVYGDAKIYGNSKVRGNVWIFSNAEISDTSMYILSSGLGSRFDTTTFFRCIDGHIHVKCGCFDGDITEFEERIRKIHNENKFAMEYLALIKVVKIHFSAEG